MGKYNTWESTAAEKPKIQALYAIANELAEANRLKRIEMLMNEDFKNLREELKDKA